MSDKIKITILEDGTIKTETDSVSMPNHGNAESFLRDMFKLAGGNITRKAKNALHKLLHGHTHEHGHDEHEHHHH